MGLSGLADGGVASGEGVCSVVVAGADASEGVGGFSCAETGPMEAVARESSAKRTAILLFKLNAPNDPQKL